MRSGWFKAGNINLKGKKSKMLSCRCCTAYDFRERELKKEHQKEIEMIRLPYPDDGGLKEPVREWDETFSIATCIKKAYGIKDDKEISETLQKSNKERIDKMSDLT